MQVFVNRTLNMKKIKAIGFDMDYTLVRYRTEVFEEMTHTEVIKKLIEHKSYPQDLEKLTFDFHAVIQGLILDRKRGNLLKLSRFGKVKKAHHGTKPMAFREQQAIYENLQIDLSDHQYQVLDTNFSVSNGVLYAQLVDMKEAGSELPDFDTMAMDIKEMLDRAHFDDTLKGKVKENLSKYIIQDPEIAQVMERFRKFGKKLLIITNSDYAYCKLLMDYTINPFLKEYKNWEELFDITITLSRKPNFFQEEDPFLSIDPKNGLMSNHFNKLVPGIYQGGNARKTQEYLKLDGEEILYIGDHIYGDVLQIKKTCNWRTALVVDPIKDEMLSLQKGTKYQSAINELMIKKELLEKEFIDMNLEHVEQGTPTENKELSEYFKKLEVLNSQISKNIKNYNQLFNSDWGELMRAGQEASRFADQIEKYACIYMEKVSDFINTTPKTYFRPHRKKLAHEFTLE